jgi:EmrB/QacA subfamily drug resistance transporter
VSPDPVFSRVEILSIMSGLLLAMFLASLDQTVVATSLSAMARDLANWELMPWVVSAYLVASTTTTPIYGRLSDLYGRRPVLLFSIGLFVAASILCGLARTMPQLVGARVLQGIGGGGLRSIAMAVIADIIPPRDRGRYQGYVSSVFGISNTFGPVLGGFFAATLSWRWIFWINIPLGIAAFWLSNRHLKRLAKPTRRPVIDWLGAVLILASATPLLIGLGGVEQAGRWLTAGVLVPICAGLVFMVGLVLRERVAPEPILPLRLFANPVFSAANLVTVLISMAMIGLIVLIPLAYQLVAGLAADEAGARLIPMTAGTVLGSFIAGQGVSRLGRYRIFPILGTGAAALTCAAMAVWGLGRSFGFDAAVTGLYGVALGFQLSPMSVAVQNALDWRDTGVGMSCLIFFRLMGGALGVALFSAVLIGSLNAMALAIPGHEALGDNPGLVLFHIKEQGGPVAPELMRALDQAVVAAFRRVFVVATVILALAFLAALWLKEVPLRRSVRS